MYFICLREMHAEGREKVMIGAWEGNDEAVGL